ncbi:unnamed protein product [Nippostrongylus brasiliensis]|uniref:Chaoptin n=1 Tax=Nippostrongylus brasiliensis TaxID=27835 RepID=A0A0N4YBQ5_NIPBR|nr:unnamed protein product [Nippostrongylus brasiliensis]
MLASTVPSLPVVGFQPQPPANIVALSMTEGGLAFVQQDAFRTHDIQALDFANNQIQTVNVNAFRGLEISIIPNMAFARLRLIVLTLSNNRITQLEKLSLPPSLSILELKNNLLTEIPYLALKDKSALQVLDLDSNNISSLQYNAEVSFKNDIKLVLRNNKIQTLTSSSLKSFRKFKELDLSYNQISSVFPAAFETISYVKALDLSYNSLAYIARGTFKNLAKNLERINLEENIFHALPMALSDLRNLTHLNMNGNKLTRLDEEALRGMKEVLVDLSLAYNRLKAVPTNALNGMVRLQHLDLSKNNIKQLDRLAFGTLDGTGKSLMQLNLAGNQLKSIEEPGVFLYMTSLAYLDLSYNQLEHIESSTFEKLPGLERLYLQNNKLRQFPIKSEQKMDNLRQLNLDNNLIEELPDNLLNSCQRLEHLSLAGNRIHIITDKIFHSSTSKGLKSLNLAGNQISTLSKRAFQLMGNLQIIRLNNNRLRTIDISVFAELRNLRHVDLSDNKIIQILPQAFTNLPLIDTLLLHHNEIERIDRSAFHRIARIETLDLSHNVLKNFTCEQLGSVQTIFNLILAHNRISHLDLTCILRSLVRLDLGGNNLESMKKNMLDGADKLTEIVLRDNGILELQGRTFSCCPKLSRIDLSHNHLRTIRKETFSDPSTSDSMAILNLDQNQIKTLESSQFLELRNLTQLIVSRNRIETIEEAAFEHLLVLKHLDISNNPVSTWSPTAFRDMSNTMDTLNLANTGLFSIPRMGHHAIRHFNLSMNKIYEINRADLAKTAQLYLLDVSYNNIMRLQYDIFTDLVNLKVLNISGNPLNEILAEQLESLYQMHNIAHSALHYNVTRLVRHLPPLRSLHIQLQESIIDEQLRDIDMTHVRHLTITGSNITNVNKLDSIPYA